MTNYHIVNYEEIPHGSTFYYLSNDGKQLKCKKSHKWGMSYKDGQLTIKRFCPMPDNWYCVVSSRTANIIKTLKIINK